jgi:hypothetical protein
MPVQRPDEDQEWAIQEWDTDESDRALGDEPAGDLQLTEEFCSP